eukprot:GFUD01038929.1.p1 GENE.GFUD01038929.1~~GFUD01038929.1.p1  ORF type:complete len:308 (-),score=94.15 GFUD01038929.1:71-994(-)
MAESLPGKSLPGLNVRQVQNERKEMCETLFQKYEDKGQNEESDEEVGLDDLDNPEKVQQIYKDKFTSKVQSSRTLSRYIRDHAEEMDEIATIAGPPLSDEEVLSDESDDDLALNGNEVSDDTIDSEVGGNVIENNLPLTPLYSTNSEISTDDNRDSVILNNNNNTGEKDYGDDETGERDYGDVQTSERGYGDDETIERDYGGDDTSESDDEKTLTEHNANQVYSDDDILYTSDRLPQTNSIFVKSSPIFHSEEPASKKLCQVPPCPSGTGDLQSRISSQLRGQEVLPGEGNDDGCRVLKLRKQKILK